ncbi:hypothetical protein AM493_17990 [Flavobacterium akiainvivens]|uniref:Uncharacterized protein n=1 Tax=Flavobacterium akiainvivens TaxID=1202724 RepID=A0A0M8MD74_9FLAO|nr:hypothetical protein [Flavobacterium akiainvivens]KOS07725.1 hypothetical protein AM493_17990 [Flavobacterium akiainvivens]SFQ25086.1 hypothetical protein SAMN05444144_102179 [Flavobacterium akiainvivens]
MKTYAADIIPKIERFSQKLDNITMLVNHHWVVLDEASQTKTVYIFRNNGQLLISVNGRVQKARWEYLGNNAILIDLHDESYLFRHGFFDKNVLALKVDSANEYAVLINESRYRADLNSIAAVLDFLSLTYGEDVVPKLQQPHNHHLPITYYITLVKESYSLRMGAYREYKVRLSGGAVFTIYKKKSNGKFFFYHNREMVQFSNKSSCIEYIERVAG